MVSCHIHYSARLFTFSFLGCEESEFEPFLVQNGRFVFLILTLMLLTEIASLFPSLLTRDLFSLYQFGLFTFGNLQS